MTQQYQAGELGGALSSAAASFELKNVSKAFEKHPIITIRTPQAKTYI